MILRNLSLVIKEENLQWFKNKYIDRDASPDNPKIMTVESLVELITLFNIRIESEGKK